MGLLEDLHEFQLRVSKWVGLPSLPPPPGVWPREMKVRYRRVWVRYPYRMVVESSATDGPGTAHIEIYHRLAGVSPIGVKVLSGVTRAEVSREVDRVMRIIGEYK